MIKITQFFKCKLFAVVGASKNTTKFGYKVLAAYKAAGLSVLGVNPKEVEIISVPCFKSLTKLLSGTDISPHEVGVSVITPPQITINVVEEAASLGIENVWLQPGAENAQAISLADEKMLSLIHSGPCLLVELQRGSHKL